MEGRASRQLRASVEAAARTLSKLCHQCEGRLKPLLPTELATELYAACAAVRAQEEREKSGNENNGRERTATAGPEHLVGRGGVIVSESSTSSKRLSLRPRAASAAKALVTAFGSAKLSSSSGEAPAAAAASKPARRVFSFERLRNRLSGRTPHVRRTAHRPMGMSARRRPSRRCRRSTSHRVMASR